MEKKENHCVDCDGGITRRAFVRTVGGAALTAATAGATPLFAQKAKKKTPTPASAAETVVKRFYESLSEKQKEVICFPFDHKLRKKISANWKITEPGIGSDFYTNEQRKLTDEILRGVTTEDGYERFQKQMTDDWGGVGKYTMAVFGEPGSGKFEWELTGRHLTLRADGNSVDRAAFGGPIIYGHGVGDPKKNLFHYQTRKANEVFAALDGAQRKQALVPEAPKESAVPIQGEGAKFPGISVGELSRDQKKLVRSVIKVILAPYRKEDINEALAVIKAGGGVKKLHMTFYESDDLGEDQVWDVWRLEGPTFVWHFRGAPHVHTYVNIGMKA